MSETHTETRNGITVTVWSSRYNIETWLYIATAERRATQGQVTANDRTEAARLALDEAEQRFRNDEIYEV